MSVPGIPDGTVLRVTSSGVPRIAITQQSGSGFSGSLMLRATPKPVLVRTPGPTGPVGPAGEYETVYFSATGRSEPRPARHRVYLEGAYTLEQVRASVNDPPLGGPWVGDVLTGVGDDDPVSIYADPADRPTIAPMARTGLGGDVDMEFPEGSYICGAVVQVGATFPGTDEVLAVRLFRTG